jgi:hypothetical protein
MQAASLLPFAFRNSNRPSSRTPLPVQYAIYCEYDLFRLMQINDGTAKSACRALLAGYFRRGGDGQK